MTPIGVTIITPSYRKVGREAVRRFNKFTGLDIMVLTGKDTEGFDLKLKLDQLCPKRMMVFFDADLWLLDKAGFADIKNLHSLLAVHDSAAFNPHAFPHTDCEAFGIPKTEYFNSGLMAWDNGNASSRRMFIEARKLKKRVMAGSHMKPTDDTDQFYLNMGRLKAGMALSMLPTNHNFYLLSVFWGQMPFIPRHIIGLHAAGEKARNKYAKLRQQAAVFTHARCLMHAEAALFEVARAIEMR